MHKLTDNLIYPNLYMCMYLVSTVFNVWTWLHIYVYNCI